MAETMTVNGKAYPYATGMTVSSLLAAVHGGSENVVVEVNGDIIPRGCYGLTLLNGGDTVEIVYFVGGG